MAFSPPEYCRLFAQKKAYQEGVTGTPGPPLATPLGVNNEIFWSEIGLEFGELDGTPSP